MKKGIAIGAIIGVVMGIVLAASAYHSYVVYQLRSQVEENTQTIGKIVEFLSKPAQQAQTVQKEKETK